MSDSQKPDAGPHQKPAPDETLTDLPSKKTAAKEPEQVQGGMNKSELVQQVSSR